MIEILKEPRIFHYMYNNILFQINNKRSHGGMKMGLPHIEDSPPRAFGVPQLNS